MPHAQNLHRLFIVLAVNFLAFGSFALAQGTGSGPQSKPCSEPEQKRLDFWVGEWDLTWPGTSPAETAHGTNSVKRILDTCVVEENFNGGNAMPLRGLSLSIYDVRAGKWKQTWVDNQGAYLDFSGKFEAGQMVLAREAVTPTGATAMQRMVFKNITRDEFDWSWETSNDSGKTWTVAWPIHYKRMP